MALTPLTTNLFVHINFLHILTVSVFEKLGVKITVGCINLKSDTIDWEIFAIKIFSSVRWSNEACIHATLKNCRATNYL